MSKYMRYEYAPLITRKPTTRERVEIKKQRNINHMTTLEIALYLYKRHEVTVLSTVCAGLGTLILVKGIL